MHNCPTYPWCFKGLGIANVIRHGVETSFAEKDIAYTAAALGHTPEYRRANELRRTAAQALARDLGRHSTEAAASLACS